MAEPPDWLDIWRAMQELGAALQPVLDGAEVPDWAADLRDALNVAEPHVGAECPEEAD